MNFTAKDVQGLRERTGAGMMDCKKALVETNGDVEKAIDFLREKAPDIRTPLPGSAGVRMKSANSMTMSPMCSTDE